MSRMPNLDTPRSPRPRLSRAAVALVVLALCAAAPQIARAGDNVDRVRPEQVPAAARAVLEHESRVGTNRVFYHSEDGFWFVHYSLPSGLRVEAKTRRDGGDVKLKPTAQQPDVPQGAVGRLFDRYVAEREGKVAPPPPPDERARIEAERARIEAERARAQAEADAERRAAEVERQRVIERARAEEAARDRARRLSERELADWYATHRYERMDLETAPREVRRALREQTAGTTDVIYSSYRKAGDIFYVAQFTTGSGRRIELALDEDGRQVDRVELAPSAPMARDIFDRDAAWDHDHGWDRDRERVSRWWVPGDARRALDDLVTGARDIDFFRIRTERGTLFAARYTSPRGRRVESRVTVDGRLVETVTMYDPVLREER